MASILYFVLVALLGFAAVVNAANAVRPTNMQGMIDEENAKCESGADSMACIKVRAMRFLDTVINNDNYKVSMVNLKCWKGIKWAWQSKNLRRGRSCCESGVNCMTPFECSILKLLENRLKSQKQKTYLYL